MARHRGWQLLQIENRGVGAARNVGVQHAGGTYLGFLDADDLLPPYAHELLVSTLDKSRSDLAVGSLRRLVKGQAVEPPWIRRPHADQRLRITFDDLPEIMVNVFAWTKVFRRSFYDKAGLSFPEGLRYEDQVASTEAYLRARVFDVVQPSVYFWRVRDDGTSITQRRHELADLGDRIRTKHMTTDLVRELGSARILDHWARYSLPGDLPRYFHEIPTCDDAYWEMLHIGVRDLFPGLPPITESGLPLPQRLVGWLVSEGRRRDAERVVGWLQQEDRRPAIRAAGAGLSWLPFADELADLPSVLSQAPEARR